MLRSLVAGAILAVLLMAPASASAEVVDRIVAVVNGEIITLYDLNAAFAPIMARSGQSESTMDEAQLRTLKEQVLGRLIDDILLEQEVKHYGLEVSEVEVDNHIRKIRNDYGMSEDEFLQQLENQGMTLDEYKERIRKEILKNRLISAKVRRKVLVTDQEVEEYYEKNKGQYGEGQEVRLGLILLPADMSAENIRESIEKGEMSFEQAAEIYSEGPGANSGGDMGFVAWKDLSPEWKSVLSGLGAGEVSEPIDMGDKQAILKLIERSAGDVPPLDEVSEQIRNQLLEQTYSQLFDDYMKSLKSKAIIENKF